MSSYQLARLTIWELRAIVGQLAQAIVGGSDKELRISYIEQILPYYDLKAFVDANKAVLLQIMPPNVLLPVLSDLDLLED